MSQIHVIRVSQTEFELGNGAVYPHAVPLDYTPTVEEFQETYNQMTQLFEKAGLLDETACINR
jgi:hypothetical protein